MFHSLEKGGLPEVKTAASLFQDLCYQNKDRLMAGIIVGGWDPKSGGSVYNIPLGGSLVKQEYAIGGSGSTYIYAYCDAYFRPNMEQKECKEFVVRGELPCRTWPALAFLACYSDVCGVAFCTCVCSMSPQPCLVCCCLSDLIGSVIAAAVVLRCLAHKWFVVLTGVSVSSFSAVQLCRTPWPGTALLVASSAS